MDNTAAAFAIFRDKNEVKIAINSLKKLGFNERNFRILSPHKQGNKDFVSEQKNQVITGAIIGAVIGAFLSCIVSLLMIFNIIPLPLSLEDSGAGKIFIMFASVGFGILFGAGGGALVGIGTPFTVSKRYGRYLSSGGYLLSVQVDNPDQRLQAEKVLTATGGQDIHLAKEHYTRMAALMESIKIAEFETEPKMPENIPPRPLEL